MIAWLFTIKLDTGARAWIGRAALDGDYAQEMVDTIRLWRGLNWLTIATAAVILTFHLLGSVDLSG
jgi:hypothetical protein